MPAKISPMKSEFIIIPKEGDTMKRLLSFLTLFFFVTMFSGCILSKSPNTPSVMVMSGNQQTFQMTVFPPATTYTWTLDDVHVTGQGGSYQFTSPGGSHTLKVTATGVLGTDTNTWSITDAEASAPIGSSGGTLSVDISESPLEGAQIIIPAGSLTETTTVYITIANAPEGLPGLSAGQCIDFGPSGTEFTAPVDLYIPYADTDNNGIIDGTDIPEDEVSVWYYNETKSSWEEVPILDRDMVNNLVHVQATHFSIYTTSVSIAGTVPTILGDTVNMSIWSYGEMPPGTQKVVGPEIDYIYHEGPPEDPIFIIDRSVDIGDNTITVYHYIKYTGYGGGSVFGFNVGIYDIDWNRPGYEIGDVKVIEQRGSASVLEVGPDHVILQVGGGSGGWSCIGCPWVFDHWIKVRLVPRYQTSSPPVAEAGPNKNANVGATVTLNGSGSTDPDNNISSYLWQQTGGPTVTLINANTAIAHFTASVAAGSTLTFRLTVTDTTGLQSTDTCSVTIANKPPVAEAGPNQNANVGATVTLNGTGSTDPDNNISSYLWQQTGGPTVTLVNANTAVATFTASVAAGSTLTFRLTVTDIGGLQSTDTCTVTVINRSPVAEAGPNQSAYVNSTVNLNGSGSTDPDNNISSYWWQQTGGPTVTLTNANTSVATFTTSVAAAGSTLTFSLTVTDTCWLQSTDTCSVTVLNRTPVAEAGPNQSAAVNGTVNLNGTGSTDPDNNISSYLWKQTSGPTVTLVNANTAIAHFTASVAIGSTLTFRLTVTDAGGLQSTDTCTITVQQTPRPPVAEAGPDQSVAVNATVNLNGSGSTDPDNNISSYLWQQTGGPTVTLTNTNTSIAHFTASVAAGSTLTFMLTVTDTGGLQSTDTCTVTVITTQWSYISAGWIQNEAIRNDNSLWAWGWNSYGELGNGSTNDEHVPTRIGASAYFVTVDTNWFHTVAIKTDGSLWTWGDNTYGELGDGTTTPKYFPTQIGTDTNWSKVAGGEHVTVAIKSDGSLWAWGWNATGELGDGTMIDKHVPTRIGTDTDWVKVSAGRGHTVAIKTDGSLWAWGWNYYGQLGDGGVTDKHVPTKIGTDTDWTAFAAKGEFSVAIKANGSLWAWGQNGVGQLGDGTTTIRRVPTRIGSGTNWAKVGLGFSHSLAIKSDGSLWTWGDNGYGQLGDGTTTDKWVPTRIGTDTDWTSVTAGASHSIALKSDGSIWTWGDNFNGQLGDGTTVVKLIPIHIN